MTTVSDQIAHEKKHAELSADKFYFKQDTLREADRGDEVDSVRSVMRQRLAEVGHTLDIITQRKGGIGGKYNAIIRQAATFDGEEDFNILAYLGVQTIFQTLGTVDSTDWTVVAARIAKKLEFEHKTAAFEAAHPGYYHVLMQSMEQQQVSSYNHIRNTLAKKMADFDLKWDDWDLTTRMQVANKILLVIVTKLSDIFFRSMRVSKDKTYTVIETTVDADDWLAEFEAERGYFNPVRLPTLIKPLDWIITDEGLTEGGYYSRRLRSTIIKAHNADHLDFISKHKYTQHLDAINKLQATEWAINRRVFDVQQAMFAKGVSQPGIPMVDRIPQPTIPKEIEGVDKEDMNEAQLKVLEAFKQNSKAAHRADRARKGKIIQYKMSYDVALMYKDMERFHFVYTADFRGRIYASTTGLSPQGNDTSKALLQFANGKPVTEEGLRWLAVHGANTYGHDKVSFDDRVAWVKDNEHIYKRIISDPVAFRADWASADKPWQYLAFIFAWADTAFGKDTTAETFIPIGLDGSCNGLQHYSALLRDEVGGRGVNLTNSDVPSDIYQDVADRLRAILVELGADKTAAIWLRAGLGRKLTKRPVMTLPYGSTQTSARAYIHEWALENRMKFPGMDESEIYEASMWLTPYLWQAIGEVVVAARVAMGWIQHRTSQLVRADQDAMKWLSPVGFPVYQPYMVQNTVQVSTRLAGGIRIRVNLKEDTEDVEKRKQRSGIAPNFVHSLDSSHMVKVLNATDYMDYAMIHDDFGTHAADTGDLWKVIREQFVELYTTSDPLRSWNSQQGVYDGEYPEMGDLDIQAVLSSDYFFG